jgi:DNA-binding NarL/FixJ family response regulator
MALRCLIVDDNHQFLVAARTLLEREGLIVVAVASTTADALRRLQDIEPDVVLVDVNLGNESGFDLACRIDSETTLDPSRVILISTHAEDDLADLLADAPAAGFLSKSRLSADAIREILDGSRETNAG